MQSKVNAMKEVYIVGGLRTPIGKTNGKLKRFLPEQLAAKILNDLLEKFKLEPQNIDEVLLGNAVGPGGNLARVSLLEAGWPYAIPAHTIDYQCGSGLSAVQFAASRIAAGQSDLVIAGGVESTSMAPLRQFNPKDPRFQGHGITYERAPFSTPAIGDPDMGEGAENVARLMDISREQMDAYALESHRKAQAAWENGSLKDIVAPLALQDGTLLEKDQCILPGLSLDFLKRLPPAFIADGRITAGNACLKHDGAAALLLCSKRALEKYGLTAQAVIRATDCTGCDPNLFPLSPVPSVRNLAQKAGITLDAVSAFEINEAFAAKVLACCGDLGIEAERTNVLGGALAYGHPYGASGAIILLHLLKVLELQQGSLGIATVGAVGGQAVSILIERCAEPCA